MLLSGANKAKCHKEWYEECYSGCKNVENSLKRTLNLHQSVLDIRKLNIIVLFLKKHSTIPDQWCQFHLFVHTCVFEIWGCPVVYHSITSQQNLSFYNRISNVVNCQNKTWLRKHTDNKLQLHNVYKTHHAIWKVAVCIADTKTVKTRDKQQYEL